MRKLLATLSILLIFPLLPAQACPLLSLTPCKAATHRVKRPRFNTAIVKHETRISSHDRWLAAHDAQFRAMAASIVSLQRQINELKAKR
jgi:hypothetical protein